MEFLISPNFWSSVLASTTPVLLVTLAANIMTKAGMFNLGIEGTMLMCALAGVLASAFTGSLFLGALLGVLLGILVSFRLFHFEDECADERLWCCDQLSGNWRHRIYSGDGVWK